MVAAAVTAAMVSTGDEKQSACAVNGPLITKAVEPGDGHGVIVLGRIAVDNVLDDYQRSYLDEDDYEKRMETLHYPNDEGAFYLHLVMLDEVTQQEGDRVMGMDLNQEKQRHCVDSDGDNVVDYEVSL
jgi:hypothetical protein